MRHDRVLGGVVSLTQTGCRLSEHPTWAQLANRPGRHRNGRPSPLRRDVPTCLPISS